MEQFISLRNARISALKSHCLGSVQNTDKDIYRENIFLILFDGGKCIMLVTGFLPSSLDTKQLGSEASIRGHH